ncbi:MAG: DUF4131 domain-containing protein [Rhodobacteraceae bacterium]|nr:DUF4131 domain-containing protein [Paracoccaceae bacterium]
MIRLPHPLDSLAAQRGALLPWVPVCLGLGIGAYFALPVEPTGPQAGALAALAVIAAGLGQRGPERWQPVATALAMIALGLLAGFLRSAAVAAPVLPFSYYGPVEGRVLRVDRSASEHMRLTLDAVVLSRVAPGETPARIRLSLDGPEPVPAPEPGTRVMTTAFLGPPGGPSEPGGFDFQRLAWFQRLGAIGYTRLPLLVAAPAEPGAGALFFNRLRQRISVAVRARIPGDAGGFVAAILTNDVSGLSQPRLRALRAANLAHVLSISGLHMALVTGFVFAMLRYGLALIPPLALRLPVKKIAAGLGLLAAAFYLMLSGAAVATERSFVMAGVVMIGVILDRRAISLRSVAISAVIVLLMQPESLIQAGFQMSYSATVALVATFGVLSTLRGRLWHPPRWAAPVLTLLLSSFVAGAATAPLSAAYFGRMSSYGLLANLLTMPVMGMLIMPGVVIAGLLSLVGLEAPALWLVGWGARWMIAVADRVAALDGAVIPVVQPPPWVLPLMVLGALWLILWQGRARWAGALPVIVALALWATAARPPLLLAESGGLAGLMTPAGRALSKATGDGFAARAWLLADADAAAPEAVAARPGFSGPRDRRAFTLAGVPGLMLAGKGAAAALPGACAEARIVILNVALDGPRPPGCRVIDLKALRRSGAIAVQVAGGVLVFRSARAVQGDRPWTRAGHRYPVRPLALPPLPTGPAPVITSGVSGETFPRAGG